MSAVNGDEANVVVEITLDSGATPSLNADGTFIYDPTTLSDSASL